MHCWFIFNVPIISNNVTCRTFVKQLLILNESSICVKIQELFKPLN